MSDEVEDEEVQDMRMQLPMNPIFIPLCDALISTLPVNLLQRTLLQTERLHRLSTRLLRYIPMERVRAEDDIIMFTKRLQQPSLLTQEFENLLAIKSIYLTELTASYRIAVEDTQRQLEEIDKVRTELNYRYGEIQKVREEIDRIDSYRRYCEKNPEKYANHLALSKKNNRREELVERLRQLEETREENKKT